MTRQEPRRSWLTEAIIIAVLVLLPLLFWWRLWALDPADRAVIPQGDFTGQYYPLQLFAAREISAGRLPAWNPFLNAGQPGLADIQTGAYYPLNLIPNLILALLNLPFSVGLLTAQVITHFSLASLFTYLFVRHLALRGGARISAARFAGAVAALSFSYAGYLTSFPVQQLTVLETAVWLPLTLLLVDRAFHHPHPRAQIILAGVTLALALLAGHPQTALYITYATLAYGVFLAWCASLTIQTSRIRYGLLAVARFACLPILLGIALSMVQIAPTLQFISHSTRAGLDYNTVSWGLPLAEVTHFLYPGYFGSSPQYVGILPPILAAAALFVRRVRREVAFWIGLGVLALLLAFGGNTFLYSVTYLLAPGFGAVRNQERIIYLFSFAVSILAGYGALTLVQPLPRRARRGFQRLGRGLNWTVAAFLALMALLYAGFLQALQQGVEINMFEGALRHHALHLLLLSGSTGLLALRRTGLAKRKWLVALTLGIIWLNLFTINWRFNLAEPSAGGPYPDTGLVAFLRKQAGDFRISSSGLLPGGASAGVVHRLEDITGNTPFRLTRFQHFEDGVGSWHRWQLLNVHYVLSKRDLDGPGLERVYEEGEVKVYHLSDPLYRAWVVQRVVTASDDEALAYISADDFDPRRTAVLPPEAPVPVLLDEDETESAVQVVRTVPGHLVLDVSTGSAGLLVISQPFYPGWQARVDGERRAIYRADHLLQGIPIEAGAHRVELTYHLSPLPAIVSLLTLAACGLGLLLKRQRA
jgi:hypothetical protein